MMHVLLGHECMCVCVGVCANVCVHECVIHPHPLPLPARTVLWPLGAKSGCVSYKCFLPRQLFACL